MALAEAIMVCLTDRPMSGYDLAKSFDASIGFFWRASHQQVYRELGRLRDRGLVNSKEIEQQGRPNRIVHTLTPEGKSVLKSWSMKPTPMPSTKDELLVRFYALGDVDLPSLREQLEVRIDRHREKLDTYHRIKSRHYDGKSLTLAEQGKLIALNMGIELQEALIKTHNDALIEISRLVGKP